MTSSKFYQIFVPTYKRDNPAILKMLDVDSVLHLILCVRDEEMNRLAYSHIKEKYGDRVTFINLGKHIHDIGETRNRILKYAQSQNIKYCVMIDDGITHFEIDKQQYLSSDECIYKAVNYLHTLNAKFNRQIIAYTFRRRSDRFIGVTSEDYVCCGIMQQAYVIDCALAEKHNITFKSLKKVGFEDAAFMLDAFKAGLYTVSLPELFMEGKAPNIIQKGGNHVDTDVDRFARSYDKKSTQLSKYIGKMYGVSFEKKFRKRYNAMVTYCIVNYAYFRETLFINRFVNSELINSHFKM